MSFGMAFQKIANKLSAGYTNVRRRQRTRSHPATAGELPSHCTKLGFAAYLRNHPRRGKIVAVSASNDQIRRLTTRSSSIAIYQPVTTGSGQRAFIAVGVINRTVMFSELDMTATGVFLRCRSHQLRSERGNPVVSKEIKRSVHSHAVNL